MIKELGLLTLLKLVQTLTLRCIGFIWLRGGWAGSSWPPWSLSNLLRDMHIDLHTLVSLCRVDKLLLFRGIVDCQRGIWTLRLVSSSYWMTMGFCLLCKVGKKILKERVASGFTCLLPPHGFILTISWLGVLLHSTQSHSQGFFFSDAPSS